MRSVLSGSALSWKITWEGNISLSFFLLHPCWAHVYTMIHSVLWVFGVKRKKTWARWSHPLTNFCFWSSCIFTSFFSGSWLAAVTDCPLHSLPFIDLYLWIFVSSSFGLTLCHSAVWNTAHMVSISHPSPSAYDLRSVIHHQLLGHRLFRSGLSGFMYINI